MPRTKKKKGGGGKNKAERSAAIAARRALDVNSLPSFPGPETIEQHLERVLGYEFVTKTFGDIPYQIRRDEEGIITIKNLCDDSCSSLSADQIIQMNFVPNYRGEATYPRAKDIIERCKFDDERLTRRFKKCLKDVPADELDVFTKFMERGENIHIKCHKCTDDPLAELEMYGCKVELADKKYDGQSFIFLPTK